MQTGWGSVKFSISNKFCQFEKPRRASSRNQGSINNAPREEWGLPRGVSKELKMMSLLILAWQNVNNFLKEGVAKCAYICLNAKCSTGQRSKSPFCQVHSHLLECTMQHRTEIQKKGTPQNTVVTKCESSLSTFTKLKNMHPCLPLQPG